MNNPVENKYTAQHGWVRFESPGLARIGITDYLQALVGSVVYVDLPRSGTRIQRSSIYATIESDALTCELPNRGDYADEFARLGDDSPETVMTKVSSPLTGTFATVNEALKENPDLVNSDPYGDGWLCLIEVADEAEFEELLPAGEYLTCS